MKIPVTLSQRDHLRATSVMMHRSLVMKMAYAFFVVLPLLMLPILLLLEPSLGRKTKMIDAE